jgi:hypothetical protein
MLVWCTASWTTCTTLQMVDKVKCRLQWWCRYIHHSPLCCCSSFCLVIDLCSSGKDESENPHFRWEHRGSVSILSMMIRQWKRIPTEGTYSLMYVVNHSRDLFKTLSRYNKYDNIHASGKGNFSIQHIINLWIYIL